MKKLWGNSKLNQQVEAFETKDDLVLDQRLVKYDCLGSLAHAKMLNTIGILTLEELKLLNKGLNEILKLDKKGQFQLVQGDEDIHTKIENYLTENFGEVGKKIHTGRSRNDQVLTAIRLFIKDKLTGIVSEVELLQKSFKDYSKKYSHIQMPGYTHMQKAMPSSVGLWAESFADGLTDDLKQLQTAFDIANQSPLGSGAGYGLPFDVKREFTAKLLGFAKVQENALYCQNSRGKFEASILSAFISILQTINKFAQDVLLFTTSEFGFFTVDETLTTGSSIMPQKKNIDLAELLRSKIHLVLGNYVAIVSLSANLPSGYNRDLQDSKKPLFESIEITLNSLKMSSVLLSGLYPVPVKLKAAMTNELYAAQDALKLAKKGIPFRSAYKKIASKYRR
ncbi:argininosuccinate lyase [Candidatus Gottesmanbacteria bacterium]|nr:argininosuccinate lyase [Candidatus Gottesmanbacteria bacterium]